LITCIRFSFAISYVNYIFQAFVITVQLLSACQQIVWDWHMSRWGL